MTEHIEAGSKIIRFYPQSKKAEIFFLLPQAPVDPLQGFQRINQVQQMEQ